MKEALGDRDVRKLFFSNLFSYFGQGMTMIGIAWYLVETTGTAQLLGSAMFAAAVAMFFVGPYIGTLIDRFSRKKLLLVENVIGFAVLGSLAIWGFFAPYQEWMLLAIYLVTTFMFQLHYPAQSALVQEKFQSKHYQAINSLLEIENQTAAVLAGGIAGLLLGVFGLHVVLLIDALTYLVAFWLLSTLKYQFTLEREARESAETTWFEQLQIGWQFIRKKRGFITFGIASLMPFIAVMAGNLLRPVFVNQTLREEVEIYSLGSMTYGVGAVAAGLLVSAVSRRFGQISALIGNTLLFAIVLMVMVAFPQGWVFVATSSLIGWCNASVRLIQQSVYMNVVPKHLMGRVISFFNSIGLLMRLGLIGLFTLMIDGVGAGFGFLVLAVLLLLAAAGIALTSHDIAGKDHQAVQ